MIRWLFRWIFRLVLITALLAVVLVAPVAWVEFGCVGDAEAEPYAAQLPEDHHRAEARTLLTYPEWHIVHAYDDYAQVIQQGDPHDFAYFRAVRTYWSSLCALKIQAAAHGGMDLATKQLVYVIGVSFSAELALKAAYEETIGRVATILRGDQHSPLDILSGMQAANYAQFLQQVPWYKWDFTADAAALRAANTHSLRDRERAFALGTEFSAKAAYAEVIAAAVAEVGADELTLRMVVDGGDVPALAQIEGVTVIAQTERGTVIETQRYRALTNILLRMAPLDLTIQEIAGNDDIMFTAVGDAPDHAQALFSFPRQGYGDHRHLFLVKTHDLLATLNAMSDGALRVEHVHDY